MTDELDNIDVDNEEFQDAYSLIQNTSTSVFLTDGPEPVNQHF